MLFMNENSSFIIVLTTPHHLAQWSEHLIPRFVCVPQNRPIRILYILYRVFLLVVFEYERTTCTLTFYDRKTRSS